MVSYGWRADPGRDAGGTPADRDRLVMGRLLRYFRRWNGRWRTPTGEAWQPALALDAVVNSYERTRDDRYLAVVERSFARYRGRRSHFYDDDGWYLNAWLRAYDVTGGSAYRDEAEALFDEMTNGWDAVCAGGLWWNRDRQYKNAITNELFLLAAARLHRRAPNGEGPGSYRDWATRAWAWFDSSGMINENGLINDGLDSRCANNGGVTWTYNQGVILGALVEMWQMTGDRSYLDRAQQIADATIATLVSPGGILTEPCEPDRCSGNAQIFKGVFAQGLARLYAANPGAMPTYRTFLTANADSLWSAARDRDNGIGLSWTGPAGRVTAATQISAALLLGEVALLDTGGAARPAPPRDGAA
ncbi:MAG TPA: glycoside hydrolase family 76 protein [Actinoplanes sp.]|nr:glycoside hydrolase family 76 protein [Actinoplanes sp.]